jgi:opacity protein-like surface antigen
MLIGVNISGEEGRFGVGGGIYQNFRGVIVGVEADLQGPRLAANPACSPGIPCSFDSRWGSSVTAVVGYGNGAFLPYLGLGGTITQMAASASDYTVRGGWVITGGLKVPLSDRVVGLVEFRHKDFGMLQSPMGDVRATTNEVRLGLLYRMPPETRHGVWW